MIEKIMGLFQAHLKAIHNLELYDYQLDIARAIFTALIQNFRLTSGATEEQIKKLVLTEHSTEISRQAGKTTAIVHAIEFIMLYFPNPKAFGRVVRIGIFAPQREQAKTDFDRLKAALGRSSQPLKIYEAPADDVDEAAEESNAKTIVLPSGASCFVFPVTSSSRPESKTLDLIIFEESQDLEDNIIKQQIWPMGASTNAPRIYIGTAGTKICHFYRLGQTGGLKLYFDQVVSQRRAKYEQTGNALHLIYEQTVKQEMVLAGADSDEIQRPYYGKWLIGTGQFTTQEDLEAITNNDRKRTFHDKGGECFAGIDIAKHPDSTVVTIIRAGAEGKKQLLNWLELRGENYQNQYDIIIDFLGKYNVLGVAIDSTGVGDFMPDMFEAHSNWRDENSGLYSIKFSQVSKSNMYKNLKNSIRELLTELPNLGTREGERFKQQILDLQQEWKGQYLSVKHPENEHDDYPDSWALAEWAYAKYNESRISVSIINSEPTRELVKDHEGKVTDHWPGADW